MQQLSAPVFALLLVSSLIVAAVLAVLRMPFEVPAWLEAARPLWLQLLVAFWALAAPNRFGMIGAWCVGLLADVLLDAPLGSNAGAAVLVAWVCFRARGVMITASAVQQAFMLLPLLLLVVAVQLGAAWLVDATPPRWASLLAAPSSALVWPLMVLVMSGGRPFRAEGRS